jgi:hypothetical protein
VGKSSLADVIAGHLGATVVHLDDAYPGWDGLDAGRDAVIESVLAPIVAGLPGRFRTWDWHRDTAGEIVTVSPTDAIVIEGCGISTPRARSLASTVIWVDCSESERRIRLLGRDGDAFSDHLEAWDRQVDAHIALNDPIGTATTIVRT